MAQLEQVIDATRDPSAKARLLAGRVNVVTCPNCQYQSRLSTPMVYHDLNKELLLIYVPMELGLPQAEQEKIVGSMTNTIVNSLSQEQRKGYLFTPKMALTMQGLLEMILEADGVTKEVIEARRVKLRLIETFMQTDPEQWPDLVKQHDDKMDHEFFDILTASAETALTNGRQDVAEQVLAVRDNLLQLSTTGQEVLRNAEQQEAAIQEVTDALNAMGDKASYDSLIDLVLKFGEQGDDKLQVLVGLARPLMDYQFFQAFTQRVDAAVTDQRTKLSEVRDRLLELTQIVDQHQETLVKQAAETLTAILNSTDLEAAIGARIDMIDDTFMAVLSANIKNAEQNKDADIAGRLKKVYEHILGILEKSAPPPIQFINELMQQRDLQVAQKILAQRVHEFGPELLQWMDMLEQNLSTRGNNLAEQRLAQLRQEAERLLAQSSSAPANPMLTLDPKSAPTPTRAPEDEGEVTRSGIILPFSSKRPSKS